MDAASTRFSRLRELFARAAELDPQGRRALLDTECAGAPELRRELEELLAASSDAALSFQRSPLEWAHAEPALAPLSCQGFRIVERIATGANGVVCRAVEIASGRHVALKLLRADATDREAVRRFEREAAILARLRHPAIAELVAASVDERAHQGTPWIATEWVEGLTLDVHAPRLGHSPHAALSLFAEICDAVAHAHRHGVVHRDLKPANILVDRRGKPRVLDFGIARLLERASTASTDHTRTGALLGTLAYMAPEQARGELALVGPRSDVYALGVILFEMLTARSARDLRGLDLLSAVRVVADAQPLRLRDLRPELPADLDLVLSRALEFAPVNRYPTAMELADDVRAILASRAVKPPKWRGVRRAARFVQRNRGLSAAAAFVVLAMSTLLAATLYSLRVERRQVAATGHTLEWLATQLLRRAPSLDSENVERDLDELCERLEAHLLRDPDNSALRSALASALGERAGLAQARSDFAAQEQLARQALAIRTDLLASDPTDLASRMHLAMLHAKLGEAARDCGDPDACEQHFAKALEIDEELVRLRPADLDLVEDLGWSLARCADASAQRGDQSRAYELHMRRLDDARCLAAAEPDNWKFQFNLSHALYYAAGFEELAGDFERGLQLARRADDAVARAIELDPLRRSLIQWRLDLRRRMAGYAFRVGDTGAGLRDAEAALGLAERLVTIEPGQAEHFRLLSVAAAELATYSEQVMERGVHDRVAATFGRLANLARFSGQGETAAELATLSSRLSGTPGSAALSEIDR